MYQIHLQGKTYGVEPGETMLAALLRQGVDVPHSCGKGTCHTCVMRREQGEVTWRSSGGGSLDAQGHVLLCVTEPASDVVLIHPDASLLSTPAEVMGRRLLSDDVVELEIAPTREIAYRAGQHIHLLRPDGLGRPYSFASQPIEDYFFRVHVKRRAGGDMSGWLFDHVQVGQKLELRNVQGDCCYDESMQGQPLFLLATGSGAGAMFAVARAAVSTHHRAPIFLFHSAKSTHDLYLQSDLENFARENQDVHYRHYVSGKSGGAGIRQRDFVEMAIADIDDLNECEIFLFGSPSMVKEARYQLVLNGVQRSRMHADPFENASPKAFQESSATSGIATEPELWDALERGPGLTRILTAFYERVYSDALLSPFFERISREFVIQKQYEFLANLFTGESGYFGLNPLNAHHWMVISDALFDHREELFEETLRADGLHELLVRRWMALHERFRADIVKSNARGLFSDGKELPLLSHKVDVLDIDTVCDKCGAEIIAGSPSRYQYRVGSLHCSTCANIPVALRDC
jgi:ferredoxin-NADP reductase/ferredoxin